MSNHIDEGPLTVGDIINYLQEYDPNLPIEFYTGPKEIAYWLSEYLDERGKKLCVDIGDES